MSRSSGLEAGRHQASIRGILWRDAALPSSLSFSSSSLGTFYVCKKMSSSYSGVFTKLLRKSIKPPYLSSYHHLSVLFFQPSIRTVEETGPYGGPCTLCFSTSPVSYKRLWIFITPNWCIEMKNMSLPNSWWGGRATKPLSALSEHTRIGQMAINGQIWPKWPFMAIGSRATNRRDWPSPKSRVMGRRGSQKGGTCHEWTWIRIEQFLQIITPACIFPNDTGERGVH